MFDPNSYGNISDRIDFEIMKNDKEIKRRMGRWEEGDDDEMEFEEEKQPEEDWSSEEEDQDSSQDSYVSSEE